MALKWIVGTTVFKLEMLNDMPAGTTIIAAIRGRLLLRNIPFPSAAPAALPPPPAQQHVDVPLMQLPSKYCNSI